MARNLKSFLKTTEPDESELCESSWLSKGFAAAEGMQHRGNKQKVQSNASRITSICSSARLQPDIATKLNKLLESVETLVVNQALLAEMSGNNISVSIGTNLLSESIPEVIEKALRSSKR